MYTTSKCDADAALRTKFQVDRSPSVHDQEPDALAESAGPAYCMGPPGEHFVAAAVVAAVAARVGSVADPIGLQGRTLALPRLGVAPWSDKTWEGGEGGFET